MEQRRLLDAQAQLRRIYNYLGETMDITRQLAEALDRNDQVSIRMLLAMREEPLRGAVKVQEQLAAQLNGDRSPDSERLRALLNGSPAEGDEERGLAAQVATNRRLLEQIRQLDQVLNRKIAGENSVYR